MKGVCQPDLLYGGSTTRGPGVKSAQGAPWMACRAGKPQKCLQGHQETLTGIDTMDDMVLMGRMSAKLVATCFGRYCTLCMSGMLAILMLTLLQERRLQQIAVGQGCCSSSAADAITDQQLLAGSLLSQL